MFDRHSMKLLSQLREYDSFLDSLRTVADVGCGTGEDIVWWATLETRDDPPRPYNYNCFAVDRDANKLSKVPDLKNIRKINKDFSEEHLFPVNVDLMFAHDSLQFSTNPLETLRVWNSLMNVNGMLVLSVPQHNGVEYNRYYSRTYSNCFFNYTPSSLIYMLAVNGFDCRDAYLLKEFQDPWINMAVYKSDIEPMNPQTTSWIDLLDSGLLHPTIESSINTHGYLRQEDIVMPWLDRENYFIDYVMPATEIPVEAGPTIYNGVINEVVEIENNTVLQANLKVKNTPGIAPVGIMRPPKKSFK